LQKLPKENNEKWYENTKVGNRIIGVSI